MLIKLRLHSLIGIIFLLWMLLAVCWAWLVGIPFSGLGIFYQMLAFLVLSKSLLFIKEHKVVVARKTMMFYFFVIGGMGLLLSIMSNVELSNVAEIPSKFAVLRYQGKIYSPWTYQVMRSFSYAGLIASLLSRNRFWTRMFLLLVALEGLLFAAKGGLAFAVILIVSTAVFNSMSGSNARLAISFKKIIVYIGAALLLFILFVSISTLRIGRFEQDVLVYVGARLNLYAFGPMHAFAAWYPEAKSSFTLGRYLFAGPADLIGWTRDIGVFSDPVELNRGVSSNVYGALRSMYEDYGYSGIAIVYLLGFFLTYVSARLEWIHFSLMWLVFVLWIPFGSLFAYNVFILAFLLSPIAYKKS